MAFPISRGAEAGHVDHPRRALRAIGKEECARPHRIVALGGGTGLPAVLEGLCCGQTTRAFTEPLVMGRFCQPSRHCPERAN